MGKERAQRRDGEETRSAILSAADSVFSERGFFGTTVKAVSERSGISQALIQHHFDGKKGLWKHVKRRMVQRFAEAQDLPPADHTLQAADVRAALWAYLRFSLENPDAIRFGMWVNLAGEEEDWGGESEVFQGLVKLVEEAQQMGFLRSDISTFDLIMAFSGMVRSWVLNQRHFSLLVGEDPDDPARTENFFESVMRLVKP